MDLGCHGFMIALIVSFVSSQVMYLGHHGFKIALSVGQLVYLGHHGLSIALIVSKLGPQVSDLGHRGLKKALIVGAISSHMRSDQQKQKISRFPWSQGGQEAPLPVP